MIKAVFFDFDGVLTTDKTGSLTTIQYLSKKSGIDFGKMCNEFEKYNHDLTLGKTTYEAIWPDLCRAFEYEIDRKLLSEAFQSTPMNTGMLALARRLKNNYSIGIITDNKKDRIDYLKKYLALESLFDPVIVSAELGYDKKSPAIFWQALNHLGITPSQSIFIDNSEKNLTIPKAMGMHTIYFDDEKNDIAGLVATMMGRYAISINTHPDGSAT